MVTADDAARRVTRATFINWRLKSCKVQPSSNSLGPAAPADVSSPRSAGIAAGGIWQAGDVAGFTAAYAAQLVMAGWVTLV